MMLRREGCEIDVFGKKRGWACRKGKVMERDMTAGFGLYILDHREFFLGVGEEEDDRNVTDFQLEVEEDFLRSEYRGTCFWSGFTPDILTKSFL